MFNKKEKFSIRKFTVGAFSCLIASTSFLVAIPSMNIATVKANSAEVEVNSREQLIQEITTGTAGTIRLANNITLENLSIDVNRQVIIDGNNQTLNVKKVNFHALTGANLTLSNMTLHSDKLDNATDYNSLITNNGNLIVNNVNFTNHSDNEALLGSDSIPFVFATTGYSGKLTVEENVNFNGKNIQRLIIDIGTTFEVKNKEFNPQHIHNVDMEVHSPHLNFGRKRGIQGTLITSSSRFNDFEFLVKEWDADNRDLQKIIFKDANVENVKFISSHSRATSMELINSRVVFDKAYEPTGRTDSMHLENDGDIIDLMLTDLTIDENSTFVAGNNLALAVRNNLKNDGMMEYGSSIINNNLGKEFLYVQKYSGNGKIKITEGLDNVSYYGKFGQRLPEIKTDDTGEKYYTFNNNTSDDVVLDGIHYHIKDKLSGQNLAKAFDDVNGEFKGSYNYFTFPIKDGGITLHKTLSDKGDAPNSYGEATHKVIDKSDIYVQDPVYIEQDVRDTQVEFNKTGKFINYKLTLGENYSTENSARGTDFIADTGDDGVVLNEIRLDESLTIPVKYKNSTGENAYINAWFDLNKDGQFTDDEQVGFNGTTYEELGVLPSNPHTNDTDATTGTHILNFKSIKDLTSGTYGFRIRVANNKDEILTPTGNANSGEVEDYSIKVVEETLPIENRADRTKPLRYTEITRRGKTLLKLENGAVIRPGESQITTYGAEEVISREEIDFSTVYVADENKEYGSEPEVIINGTKGFKEYGERLLFVDGHVFFDAEGVTRTEKVLLRTVDPEAKQIKLGTKPKEREITFDEIEIPDPTKPEGYKEIIVYGENGLERTTYALTGNEDEIVATTTMVRDKKDQEVVVGTGRNRTIPKTTRYELDPNKDLGTTEIINPGKDGEETVDGRTIAPMEEEVIRFGTKPFVQREEFPLAVIYEENPDKEFGDNETIPGKNGFREIITTIDIFDGVPQRDAETGDYKYLEEVREEDKVDTIIKVGTKPKVVELPFNIVDTEDESIPEGEIVVDNPGKVGTETTIYELDTLTGDVTPTTSRVDAEDRVVRRGTGKNITTPRTVRYIPDENLEAGVKETEVEGQDEVKNINGRIITPMEEKVVRVGTKPKVEKIPFDRLEERDSTKPITYREIKQIGIEGERTTTYEVNPTTGELTETTVETKPKQDEITVIGDGANQTVFKTTRYIPDENLERGTTEEEDAGQDGESDVAGTVITPMRPRVVRVGTKPLKETLDFNRLIEKDPTKPIGYTEVKQTGENGTKTTTYKVDENTGEVSVDNIITVDPRDEITVIGIGENVLVPKTTIYIPDENLDKGTTIEEDAGEDGENDVTGQVVKPMRPRIIKVGVKPLIEELAYNSITEEDPTKPIGYREVKQVGEDGTRTTTYKVNPDNGEVSVDNITTVDPKDEIIVVGIGDNVITTRTVRYIPDETLEKGETEVEIEGQDEVKDITGRVITPMEERVIRVGTKPTTRELDYEVIYETDENRVDGGEQIKVKGEKGTETITYTVDERTGELSEITSITKEPINEIRTLPTTKVKEETKEDIVEEVVEETVVKEDKPVHNIPKTNDNFILYVAGLITSGLILLTRKNRKEKTER